MAGDRTAVGQALELYEAPEEEQLGLFSEPETEAGKALAGRRGAGRPPGARNKRTERTVSYLLSRHRDPREVLLEVAEANEFDLAARWGCHVFEAVQEKRLAAAAVLPYVAQKQPIAVDLVNRQVIHLTINEGQVVETNADDGIGFTAQVIENIEGE